MTSLHLAVIGAGGRTGRRIAAQLAAAGHHVTGLVRSEEQAAALQPLNVHAILGDLQSDWEHVLNGAQAVVWAAGGHLDPAQYDTIDRAALISLADTLKRRGPTRLIVISSMGMNRIDQMPPFMQAALNAKLASDTHVQHSGLDFTIIRPGGLSDEPGVGTVQVAPNAEQAHLPRGMITRDDVAAMTVAVLNEPGTIGKTLEVTQGTQSIPQALETLR